MLGTLPGQLESARFGPAHYNSGMRSWTLTVTAVSIGLAMSACKPSSPPSTGAPSSQAASSSSSGAPAGVAARGAASGVATQASGNTFTGTVTETMNSGGYTYARLRGSANDDVWVAAPQFDARVGEQISVALDMPMREFESKTLKRTFPLLYFVADVARNGNALTGTRQAAPPALMTSHGSPTEHAAAPVVAKISPPAGGMSIAEVFAKRTELSGRPVTVRGTVVKFNGGILDRNWIHVQDGSGAAGSKDNDLTITTDAPAKVGDVITASGVLGINRDFGAGYAYDAIVEKAQITNR
jgi:hypothetical protein